MSGPFSRDSIIGIYHGSSIKLCTPRGMRRERERWGRGDCLDWDGQHTWLHLSWATVKSRLPKVSGHAVYDSQRTASIVGNFFSVTEAHDKICFCFLLEMGKYDMQVRKVSIGVKMSQLFWYLSSQSCVYWGHAQTYLQNNEKTWGGCCLSCQWHTAGFHNSGEGTPLWTFSATDS